MYSRLKIDSIPKTVHMRKIGAILTGLAFLAIACFKVEGEIPLDDDDSRFEEVITIFYPSNDLGLLAKVYNERGDTVLVFGTFFRGSIREVRMLSYVEAGNDTVAHLLIDRQTRLVDRVYAAHRSGRRFEAIFDFDDYGSFSCTVAYYTTNWRDRSQLEWIWRVDKSGAAPTALPVYSRDNCQLLREASSIDWNASVRQVLQAIAEAPAPAAKNAPARLYLRALGRMYNLLRQACDGQQMDSETQPSRLPFYPLENEANFFYSWLPSVQPCLFQNGLNSFFTVEIDEADGLRFTNVRGMSGPLTYSVNGSPFQSNPVFTGPYDGDRPHLFTVRDADGCMNARVGMALRPGDNLCAAICDKDWTAFEAQAIGRLDGAFLEGNCNLLMGGCAFFEKRVCQNGETKSYQRRTYRLQSFNLRFSNNGQARRTEQYRFNTVNSLNITTCNVNAAQGEGTETYDDTFEWFPRRPGELLLYDREQVFYHIRLVSANELFVEHHNLISGDTYRFRLRPKE
jgi:hypothetical protein